QNARSHSKASCWNYSRTQCVHCSFREPYPHAKRTKICPTRRYTQAVLSTSRVLPC
ncbi:putative holliday junction resolvase, partial [Chlamydia psittaci C1/97]